MSKPESIKIEPWTDFPRQPTAFITDDFVHEKLAVLKVNSKSDRSTVNVKATVSADKTGVKSISDQVKLWFNLDQNRAIYTRLKSSNYLKVHYDHGITEGYGKKWNLYASLNTNKVLQNLSVRLGVAHLGERCHSDNRIKIDLGPENRNNVTWYHRTICNYDSFTFGLLGAYGIVQNILVKNNVMAGYKFNKNSSVYLRAENDGYRQTAIDPTDWRAYFDTIKINYIGSYNSNIKFGAEIDLRTRPNPIKGITVVAQHYEESFKLTTKVSFGSNRQEHVNASLLLKFPSPIFTNIGTVSLGAHISELINTEKRGFKYGGQVEFNV